MPKKITFLRIKRRIIRAFFHEQWSLLVCGPGGNILAHIAPPPDRFWADPFPVEHEGKTYIFMEQQIGHGNGTLGFIELYKDLSHSPFTPILEKSYHLSFPNVFCVKQDGKTVWYMIPETHENKTIDLYRAAVFPGVWEFEMTLMKGVTAADTTLIRHNSMWWLFTSLDDGTKPLNANLSVFYAGTFPTDKWTAHPQNPAVSTLSNSRMAGKIFERGGVLYRPAQNCLKDYGKETNVNKITTLTPLEYGEEPVRTIPPERELCAVCTHTLNYSDHYLLRDIKTRRPRFTLSRA